MSTKLAWVKKIARFEKPFKSLVFFLTLSVFALSFNDRNPFATGVTAELLFNEGTGTTTADGSGNAHPGTLVNGPVWSAGKYGQGLSLDGTNDYVNIPDHADFTLNPAQSYTWGFWVKNNNFNEWSTLWSQTLDGSNLFYIYTHTSTDAEAGPVTNGISVYWYGWGGSAITRLVMHSNNNVLTAGQWSYISVTYNPAVAQASRFTIYVNGTDVSNRSDVVSSGTLVAVDPTNVRVGSNQPYGEYLNGAVDEIRYYRRLLSVAEIQSDMNIGNTPDTQAPSVTITSPAAGNVSGTVNVTANATDNVGVAGVQFLLDGVNLQAEDITSPFSISANTATIANGNHTLTARARDAAGNITTSAGVIVNVNNDTQAPTVAITAPGAGTVSGTVNVNADASDNIGVAGVQFLLDGTNLSAEDVSSPYSVSWSTATVANGSHTLTARARDAAGNTTTSSPVIITVSNSNLVAAYGFSENTGTTVADNSGNNNNGILTNGPTWSASGKYGSALLFDGTNDLVDIADANSLDLTTGMTLEAWVNPSNVTGYKTVICKENSTNNLAYALSPNDNAATAANQRPNSRIRIGANTRTVTGTSKLALNTWTHIASTYDGTTMRLYINGVQVSTFATTGSITATTNLLRIGGSTALAQYFTGLIDEVRIYSRALSQAEIQTDMNTPIAPDVTAPAVAITAPSAGSVSGTVNVTANASDNTGVTGVQFLLDGTNLGTEDLTAPYTVSLNTTTISNGDHILTARARDAAGNTTTSAQVVVNVNNDATAPAVTITAPAAGTIAGTVNVTADATDNVAVSGVQFLLDGSNLGAEDLTAPYAVSWNTTVLADGDHTLTAKARDAAGNITTSAAVIVSILNNPPDTQAPTVSITAPVAGNVLGSVNITADAADNTAVVGVQFLLDGVNLGTEDLTAPYVVSWNTISASNGNHTLTARARDAAGNTTTSAQVIVNVNNDVTAPVTSITAPAAGTIAGTLNVTADATDNVGVSGVQFLLDGNNLGAEDLTAPYAVSWNTNTIADGDHTLTARARDAAGNTTTSAAVIVAVLNHPPDTQAPTVSITAPVAGNVVGSVNVTANASDNESVAGVQFLLDGNNLGAEDVVAPYSVSWNTLTATNGNHTLTARARDAAGNTTTSSQVIVNVNNDVTAPIVSITAPAAGTIAGTVNVTADATDNVGVVGVQFLLDGNNLGSEDISSPYLVSWNTTGVADGNHTLTARARDAAGNITTSVAIVVGVLNNPPDTQGPAVNITAPAAGNVTGTVSVTANASDNTSVSGVQFLLDGANLGTEDLVAPYAVSWNTTSASNGNHTLTARARDAAGNVTVSADVVVVVSNDLQAPDVSITAPAAGNVTGTISITANASDNVGVTGVQFLVDGNNSGAEDLVAPYSVSWNTVTVTNGNHTLTARARDAAGNITTSSAVIVNVSNDTQAPVVAITAPAAGNVTGTINITANATDNTGITGVQFILDGTDFGSEDIAAPYAVSWNTTSATNGNHTLTARARDAAGNVTTSAAVIVNVNNDLQAPAISITAPAAGNVTGTINVNATATDNVGVVGVQFLLDGSNLSTEDVSSPYSVSWITTTATNGSHTLTARARDAAGNTTTSAAIIVNVNNDIQIPVVSITAPAAGNVTGTISVTATATDNVGVTGVQFLLDGSNLSTEDVSSPYSVSWSTTTATNGSHTLTARARDAAGNTTTSAGVIVTVNNDTQAPVVSITAPAAGNVTGTINVNATATDNTGVAGVQFLLDGANLSTEDVSSPYSISWNTATTANGSHTLTARARDAAGNTTTSSAITVTVNNAVTPTNMTAALPFNEGSGTSAADISGNNHPGTLVNGPTWTAGKYGQAVNLDGTNDYVNIPDHADFTLTPTQSYSWSFWVKNTNFNEWSTLWSQTLDGSNLFYIYTHTSTDAEAGPVTNGISVYWYGWSGSAITRLVMHTNNNVLTAGQWSHVAVTYNAGVAQASRFTIYVNGVDVSNRSDVVSSGTLVGVDPTNIRAGSNQPYGEYINGALDDIRYYRRLQTQAEIQTDMNTPLGVDNVAPVVTMTAPVAGNVSGTINVTANATDNFAVAGVQFLLDGANLGAEDLVAPYSVSWNTTAIANGNHTLTARARDAAGNNTTATTVTVNVSNDTENPTVSITAPVAGNVSETINVTANATDNVGVAGVQFLLDGVNLGAEDVIAPYTVSWNTTTVANGNHTLTARARDAAGNTLTSSSVVVNVANAGDIQSPTVAITAPAAGNVSGAINVTASASDNIGVVGVQFLLDGSNLGSEDLTAPYTISWNTETAANGAHVLTARARDAAGNNTTSAGINVSVVPDMIFTSLDASKTVAATGSTSFGVNLTYRNGFSSNVALSVSGLPSGTTGNYQVNPMTSQGQTQLVVTTSNAAAGTYTLTLTATGGSITRTQTATLIVSPAADFSLSASPSVQNVTAGNGISYTITLNETGDFVNPVALSVTGLVAGMNATFNPSSVVPVGTSVLTITTTAATAPGSYNLTVQGTNGATTRTIPVTLVVSSSPPVTWPVTSIGSGWDMPIGAVFSKDGKKLFVWEKGGKVFVLNWNTATQVYDKQTTEILNISPEVGNWADHGLTGFALDPNFETTGLIYLLYTVDRHYLMNFGTPNYNASTPDMASEAQATIGRVARFKTITNGSNLSTDLTTRTVLLGETRSTGIPVLYDGHGMGSLVFASDGTLLVSAGDGASYSVADTGNTVNTYYSQALGDGIIRANENVGAFRSQMLNSHNGKILRIDPVTGNGIPSNPFYSAAEPRAPKSRVWALGFRNPFRFNIRPGTGSTNPAAGDIGELYVGDVGWNIYDELDIVKSPGTNFGWPIFEGLTYEKAVLAGELDYYRFNTRNKDELNPLFGSGGCTQQYFTFNNLLKQVTADGSTTINNPCNPSTPITSSNNNRFVHARPAMDWKHQVDSARVPLFSGNNPTLAQIGSAASNVTGTPFNGNCSIGGFWYTGDLFPANFRNTYFHADYGAQWIKTFTIGFTDVVQKVESFTSGIPSIVCLTENPLDGSIVYVDIGTNSVKRIGYGGNQLPVVKMTSDVTYGPSALTVNFNGINSFDPDGGPVSYQWNFGDGNTSQAANPTNVFTAVPTNTAKKFTVTLTVKDNQNATATDSIIISVNNTPPVVHITSPVNNSTYRVAGDSLYAFTATVTDAEHSPGQLKYEWQKFLCHNTHQHASPIDTVKNTASLINRVGCNGDDYYWMIKLKVTDAAGLFAIDSSKIFPDCSIPALARVSTQMLAEPDFEEPESDKKMLLFPNPTENNFTIRYNAVTNGTVTIRMHDVNGKLVNTIEKAVSKGINNLNIRNLPSWTKGIYLVSVQLGKDVQQAKLLFEK